MHHKLTFFAWIAIAMLSMPAAAQTAEEYADQGRAAMSAGNPAQAVTLFSKAIRLEPDNAEHLHFRAAAQYQSGNFELALRDMNAAIPKADPESLGAMYYLSGNAQLHLRKFPEAASDLKKCMQYGKKDKEVFKTLGIAESESGNHLAALDYIEKALELDATDHELLRSKGIMQINAEAIPQAIMTFTEYIDRVPNDPDGHVTRGILFYEVGEMARAKKDLMRGKSLDPRIADIDDYLGRIALHEADGDAAMRHLDAGLEKEPDNKEMLVERAVAKIGAGNYKGAEQDAQRAIELGSKNPNAFSMRGLARANMGKFEAARKDIGQAIALEPGQSLHYFSRAELSLTLEDYPAALKDLDKAITLDPKNAEFYAERALTYHELGKDELAEKDRKKALELGWK